MKLLTFLAFIFPLFLAAQSDSIPTGKLGVDYNVTSPKGLKEGYWVRVYEDGSTYYTGQFKEGKPYGKFHYYYDSGELMNIALHKENNVTYSEAYRRDGSLISSGNYLNQKKNGEWKLFNEKGIVLGIDNYKEDVLHGEIGVYYDNGQLAEKLTYVDGVLEGAHLEYFKNGKPKGEGTYVNGNLHGPIINYQLPGVKLYEGQLKDGVAVGEWKYYLEDGRLKLRILYDDFGTEIRRKMENGEVEDFYPSGIPKSYYEYKHGNLHGWFEEYYDKGDFVKQEVISSQPGEPIEFKETLENTQVKMEGEYRQGKLHGEIIYYNEDGTIEKKENYEHGTLIE